MEERIARKINVNRTQIEVFTNNINEAVYIATLELGDEIREIEDYHIFYQGEEQLNRFVFVKPEHILYPRSYG